MQNLRRSNVRLWCHGRLIDSHLKPLGAIFFSDIREVLRDPQLGSPDGERRKFLDRIHAQNCQSQLLRTHRRPKASKKRTSLPMMAVLKGGRVNNCTTRTKSLPKPIIHCYPYKLTLFYVHICIYNIY